MNGATASSLLEEWPFLFNIDGLATTFTNLTSVDLRDGLGSNANEKLLSIVQYMEEEATNKSVRVLSERRIKPAVVRCQQAVLPATFMLL